MGIVLTSANARLLRTLVVIFAILGIAAPAATAPALAQSAPAPLDLAAMVLMPDDLEELGFPRDRLTRGFANSLDDLAAQTVAGTGRSATAARAELAGFGVRRGYTLVLDRPVEIGRAGRVLHRTVVVVLVEFAAAGPATEFAFASLTAAVPSSRPVTGTRTFGDQSNLQRYTTSGRGAADVAVLALNLRLDRVMASVSIFDPSGRRPGVSEVERLGERLVDRVAAGLDGDAPGLSVQAMTVAGPAVEKRDAVYLRRGGESFLWIEEDPIQATARSAVFGEATDVYFHTFLLPADADDRTDDVGIQSHVFCFADANSATVWFDAVPAGMSADPGVSHVEFVESAPASGHQSLTVAYRWPNDRGDGADSYLLRVFIRVGATVGSVRIVAPRPFPPAVIEDFAAAQEDCLLHGVCGEAAPVPVELAGGSDWPVDRRPPVSVFETGTSIPPANHRIIARLSRRSLAGFTCAVALVTGENACGR
jgi:hypothetical protein